MVSVVASDGPILIRPAAAQQTGIDHMPAPHFMALPVRDCRRGMGRLAAVQSTAVCCTSLLSRAVNPQKNMWPWSARPPWRIRAEHISPADTAIQQASQPGCRDYTQPHWVELVRLLVRAK